MTKYEYYKALQSAGLFEQGIRLGVIPVEAATHMAICDAYLSCADKRHFYRNSGQPMHARHISRVVRVMGLRLNSPT